jgi:integrase
VGSVYRQKGRTNYMIKYYRDGQAVIEATGTSDEKEARKTLHARETDIDRGVPLATGVGKIKFEKAAENLKAEYRLNGRRSVGDLHTTIDLHLQPVFGGRKMSSISAGDARKYADDKIAAGYKAATVNKHLAALIRMFTLAVKDGSLLQQPKISKLTLNNTRQGFFEREEFDRVLAAMPVAMRDPLEFAYFTGWRVQSEVLPLEWGRNVDERGGVIRLNAGETKNGEGRVFPYDALPELAQLLARLRRDSDARQKRTEVICPWVFHDDGRPLTLECGWASHEFRRAWREAVTVAGCPARLPHDLRRTAVRNLVRAGVPEKTAMMLTGHKTRSVFDRYDIVNEADLRQGVARLAQAGAQPTQSRGKVLRLRGKR